MNEASVSRKLREAAVSLGAVCWKTSDRFHASRPDLMVFYNGRNIPIEVKVYPNKLTPLQELTLTELYNVGLRVFVATYYPFNKTLLLTEFNYGGPPAFTNLKEAAAWLLKLYL